MHNEKQIYLSIFNIPFNRNSCGSNIRSIKLGPTSTILRRALLVFENCNIKDFQWRELRQVYVHVYKYMVGGFGG